MDSLFSLEKNYDAAKARLQAAQQEKLEAAAEFLSARAALRQTLEALWPSPCECGENSAVGQYAEARQTLIAGNWSAV